MRAWLAMVENRQPAARHVRAVLTLPPGPPDCAQALSIRPDLLSPAAMNELQKLCDKVPSFDSKIAMQVRGTPVGARYSGGARAHVQVEAPRVGAAARHGFRSCSHRKRALAAVQTCPALPARPPHRVHG
jgi:hypothetical protein